MKEKLLKALQERRIKLEIRKRRFELWQEQIEKKDEAGKATINELHKSLKYWTKQTRLEDRIEAIENKIRRIENSKYETQITLYRRTINA